MTRAESEALESLFTWLEGSVFRSAHFGCDRIGEQRLFTVALRIQDEELTGVTGPTLCGVLDHVLGVAKMGDDDG